MSIRMVLDLMEKELGKEAKLSFEVEDRFIVISVRLPIHNGDTTGDLLYGSKVSKIDYSKSNIDLLIVEAQHCIRLAACHLKRLKDGRRAVAKKYGVKHRGDGMTVEQFINATIKG